MNHFCAEQAEYAKPIAMTAFDTNRDIETISERLTRSVSAQKTNRDQTEINIIPNQDQCFAIFCIKLA